MDLLYSESDLNTLMANIKKKKLICLLLSLPFFILGVTSFILHLSLSPSHPLPFSDLQLRIACMVFIILATFILIFGFSFILSPLNAYRKHINNSLHGRTHEAVYEYAHLEPYESVVDGVTYRSLVVNGTPDRHGISEHMLYWDVLRPIPDFTEGEKITFRYYDRFAVGWSRQVD